MILSTHGIVGSQIQSFVGLLDTYPNAAVAYSIRKLRTAYTGSAIRVRRSSDNTEQDIGFSGANLDTSALTSFCGSGNGFVTTWYDQSGNGRNATQTTAANQPQIVSTGSVIMEASKPTLEFNGSKRLFNTAINISQPITRLTVGKSTNTSNAGVFVDSNTTATRNVLYNGAASLDNNGKFVANYDNALPGVTLTNNSNRNLFYELQNSGNMAFSINGNTEGTNTNNTNGLNGLSIGDIRNLVVGNYGLLGNMQELVIYGANQSSNKSGLLSNINTYYGIY
jgi:hypothetical protein